MMSHPERQVVFSQEKNKLLFIVSLYYEKEFGSPADFSKGRLK
jgi:hypothetical protein